MSKPKSKPPIVFELQIPTDGSISDQEAGHMMKILIHDVEEKAHQLLDTAQALLRNTQKAEEAFREGYLLGLYQEVMIDLSVMTMVQNMGFIFKDQKITCHINKHLIRNGVVSACDREDAYMMRRMLSEKFDDRQIPYLLEINDVHDLMDSTGRDVYAGIRGYIFIRSFTAQMQLSHTTMQQLIRSRVEAEESVATAQKQVDDLPRAIRKVEAKFAEHLLKKTKTGQELLALK